MSETQMGVSVAVTSQALNFQANMASAVDQRQHRQRPGAGSASGRAAGMAAQGVGSKLDVEA